jgi:hypothetical protein
VPPESAHDAAAFAVADDAPAVAGGVVPLVPAVAPAGLSTFALVSMYLPSAPLLTQPVTEISRALSAAGAR